MMNYQNKIRTDYTQIQRNNNDNISNNSGNNLNLVSVVGEKKRLKVQYILKTAGQENNCSILINPKTWPNLKVDDLLEISAQNQTNSVSGTGSSVTNPHNTSLNRGASINPLGIAGNTNTSVQQSSQPQLTYSDEELSPFLLQVTQASFSDTIPIENIRIDQASGSAPFNIKQLTYQTVTCVDKSAVMLDLVEILFKEQYVNGYDMLRIKKHMENTCVYLRKNIEFCSIRCSVRKLWHSNGDVVTCGYVGPKTRLAFRSQSAMCTIYIQMSREMWEFDVNGEMYHEKAINFLGELFANWKNQSCTHDVTIALFSRIYYNTKSIEDFPEVLRSDIKKDTKDRFYEDFYRIVYQNERFEDWTPTLVILKRLIKEYRDYILNYHRSQNLEMPSAVLSSAAEGNFLETLNLSSSVFERHYIDRPFDRTGMMSLVITAGNGVFEVSRELTKITKERVIDNAIGSDLVCLGEQPLHAVPLFKYDIVDAFSIPNWINLSRYLLIIEKLVQDAILPGYCPDKTNYLKSLEETDYIFEDPINKSSVDSNISKRVPSRANTMHNFQAASTLNQNQSASVATRLKPRRPNNVSTSNLSTSMVNNELANAINKGKRVSTNENGENIGSSVSNGQSTIINQNVVPVQQNTTLNNDENDDFDEDSSLEYESESEIQQVVPTNALTPIANGYNSLNDESSTWSKRNVKSKANPFKPTQIKLKMSFQKRPWAHAYPLSSDGNPIFPNETTVGESEDTVGFIDLNVTNKQMSSSTISIQKNCNDLPPQNGLSSQRLNQPEPRLAPHLPLRNSIFSSETGKLTLKKKNIWESILTAEQSTWKQTGVAWKSLTTPACLPLTTDFFPSKEEWNKKFSLSSDYSLVLEGIRDLYGYDNYHYDNISMAQVFIELVGHRLAMGFQIVVPKYMFTYQKNSTSSSNSKDSLGTTPNSQNSHLQNTLASNFISELSSSTSVITRTQSRSIKGYYKLSLGRIYHELFYIVDPANNSDYIKVEIYVPREKKDKSLLNKSIEYRYRFQVPDSKTYELSQCEMSRRNTESIKWNDIDSYICIQGNGKLTPSELHKCWRQRLYLVPVHYLSNKSLQNFNSINQQSKPNEPNQSSSYPNSSVVSIIDSFSSANLTQSQIPQSMIQVDLPTIRCDVYQRKSIEELKFFRDYYFIKFMEGINKLNRVDDKRSFSKSTLAYLEAYNLNTNQNISNSASSSNLQNSSINTLGTNTNNSSANNLNNTASASAQGTDIVIAVPAIMNTISQLNSTATTYVSKSQLTILPTVNLKNYLNQLQNIKKLVSPKKALYPMVLKYNSLIEQKAQNNSNAHNLLLNAAKNTNSSTPSTTPNSFINSNQINPSVPSEQTLRSEIIAYINSEYAEHMLKNADGVPFICSKNDIPSYCFISCEAVWWCIEHISEIENEADAIVIMQVMSDFDIIRHISNQQKIFIHGFYLYYIITDENRNHKLYTKDYCEVGYCDIDCSRNSSISSPHNSSFASSSSSPPSNSSISLVSVKDLLQSESVSPHRNTLPVVAQDMFRSYLNLFSKYSKTVFNNMKLDPIIKLANVDVDPSRKSNRVEWASAIYRSHYHQLCAFELEIQWEMATGALLSELVSGWSKLSNRFNYHIIPAPIDPFATPMVPDSDPLRGRIYIELNVNCLIQNEKYIFEEFIDKKYKLCHIEISADRIISSQDRNESTSPTGSLDISSVSSSLSDTATENIYKTLQTNNPEFVDFLHRKNYDKKNIEKNAQDDGEFLKNEFQEFIEYERIIRFQYFQEAILEKFGFVRSAAIVKSLTVEEESVFFIHSSGGMFIAIPNYFNNYSIRSRHASANSNKLVNKSSITLLNRTNEVLKQQINSFNTTYATKTNPGDNMHIKARKIAIEDNRSIQTEEKYERKRESSTIVYKKTPFYGDTFVGFLWSWNYMLGKRWRSQYTGDESFQDNMLADFKKFCSNQDGRLLKFFLESKEQLK